MSDVHSLTWFQSNYGDFCSIQEHHFPPIGDFKTIEILITADDIRRKRVKGGKKMVGRWIVYLSYKSFPDIGVEGYFAFARRKKLELFSLVI